MPVNSNNYVSSTTFNQAKINTSSANIPIDNKISDNESMKKNTKLMLGATALALAITGGLLIKHNLNVSSVKKMAEQNKELENIFNNLKIEFKGNNGNKENLTVKEIFDKYLRSTDTTGKTFYHGTSIEAAQQIEKNGMKQGRVGFATGNFRGSYLCEDEKVAERYAQDTVKKGRTALGDKASAGAVISVNIPDGSKLAQFEQEDGTLIKDFLYRLFDDKQIENALQSKKLYQGDFINYLQNHLSNQGYAGVRVFDAHTGVTPIIFDGKIATVSNISKI